MPWRLQPAHLRELLARWQSLGQGLGKNGPSWDAEGHRLIRSWGRWPRAYHDTTHLRACLSHLQAVEQALPGAVRQPHAVALALWYHDAVYWPWSSRNEERSAEWACRFLHGQGLPGEWVQAVRRHILDTRHAVSLLEGDAQWVVDIDLAILGQEDAVYRQFERNVRREYFFVRWPRYVAGRSAVLQGFLGRSRIYATDFFAQRYEQQARTNLGRALEALASGRLYG